MKKIPVDFRVEQGVEIPVQRAGVIPVSTMEVGQSIRFPIERRVAVQSYASRLKKATGKTYTIKKLDSEYCRIWRVK